MTRVKTYFRVGLKILQSGGGATPPLIGVGFFAELVFAPGVWGGRAGLIWRGERQRARLVFCWRRRPRRVARE